MVHEMTTLSLAAVDFDVPSGRALYIRAFTVGVTGYSGWLSQLGEQDGFTIAGALLTSRALGLSASVRLLRPLPRGQNISTAETSLLVNVSGHFYSPVGSSMVVAAATTSTDFSDGQQGLRLLEPEADRLRALPGDVLYVACTYSSKERVLDVHASWVSPEEAQTEICAAELLVYPAAAIDYGRHTALPQQCTELKIEDPAISG